MKTGRTEGAAWRRILKWGATAPFLALGLLVGQAQAQEAEDGYLNLVAYWNFDDAVSIEDDMVIIDEVAEIEGLIEGSIYSADGRTDDANDKAIDLGEEPDGQIYIDAIEDEDFFLKPASDFDKLTVVVWQKLHRVQNSSTFWFGAPSAGANNRNAQAHIPWSNNNIYFDTAGCCNGGTQRINKGWDANAFLEWHHYTFVKDGPDKRIYIDGKLFHSGRNTLPLKSDWNKATIGAEHGGANKTAGILDDFAVYASVLTEAEIAELAAGTKPDKLPDREYTFPRVVNFNGTMGGFSLQINDITRGASVKADPDSVTATLDGEAAEVVVSKDGNVTSVEHGTAAPFAPGSSHTVVLTFKDTAGNEGSTEHSFNVSNYGLVKSNFAVAEGDVDKSTPGWLVNTTQISSGQGVGNIHGNSTALAQKQIDGGFIDPSTEEPFLNEADPDAFDAWSYYYVTSDVINFNQDAPGAVGNFNAGNGHEDLEIPGIPGWGDSTDGIVSEFLTYAYLEKGAYTFGVNSDDGFQFSSGADFQDTSAVLGGFNGGRGANDTTFQVYVEATGYYPIRVVWYEGGGGANVEVFHIDSGGNKILLGDPDNDGAIKCYAVGGVPLEESTTKRPSTGRSYLLSIDPPNGEKLVKSSKITAVLSDGEKVSVDKASIKLSVDGESVNASVDSGDGVITVTYTADPGLEVGSHTASLSFSSGGVDNVTDWGFSIPSIYSREGDVPTEAQGGLTVREYHGIGTTSLQVLKDQAKFPDSPDLTAIAAYFEWPQSGDIEVNPPGNVRDNYGWHLSGFIHPPETGEYIFSVATDDNSELWLSTDADPSNARKITQESTWVGVRAFQPMSDETTSSPVLLEAGKAYFIECFAKEGGGGDNMAVAWSLPSDEGFEAEAGALPISGEYLSPFTWTGPEIPELGAVAPGGVTQDTDFTVKATINNGQSVKVSEFTKLEVGGKDVLGDAEVVLGGISSSISADASGDAATEYSITVEWKNSDGSTGSHSYSIMTAPHSEDTLYIETEDFNYDGGEWFTFEETDGGGAYEGLGAVSGIDFNNSGNASPNYRDIPDNHPGMADSTGFDGSRGEFDMDVDFKMGWNDNGDWYNYTRDFPAKSAYYNVIGRFSSGGGPVDNSLSIVTGDATEEGHSVEQVGKFNGPPTACWNCMEFYPLRDGAGNLAAVKIAGETTVRLTKVGGNMDANYMAFVPAAVQEYPPVLISTAPAGAASSEDAIQVVLKKRELAIADAGISINGEAVGVDVATNGDTITITAKSNPSKKGMNTASVSFNGQSSDWSYFYYGAPLSDDGLNLIAHWDFEDQSDAESSTDSILGLKGTFAGGAKYGAGKSGSGLDISGSGSAVMLVEDGEFMNIASSVNKVTVAFWQKVDQVTNSSSFWAYSPSTGAGGRAAQAHSPWSNGAIYWDTAGCCGGGDTRINTGGGTVTAGADWHHYAFVKNGDAKEIWVNGKLVHSGTNTGKLPSDISRLGVGAMIDNATRQDGGNSLEGQIDDFKVFAQALSEAQINGLMEAGEVDPPTISVVRNADGTVTVTFDGTLQTAPAVNGPWTDVDAASPLTIPADAAAAFGRAKK